MKPRILSLLTISGSMLLTFSVTAAETAAPTATKTAEENQGAALKATYTAANILLQDEATQQEGLAQMKKLAATPNLKKVAPEVFHYAKLAILKIEQHQLVNMAPDIVGTDHEGKEFKLSDYRGKVVLLSFWATW